MAATVGIHAGWRRRWSNAVPPPAGKSKAITRCYTRPPSAEATRIIVIVALIAVVGALFTALVFLYRDRGHGNRVVIALAIRVLLSMALIAFLVFSWWMGWISPEGL